MKKFYLFILPVIVSFAANAQAFMTANAQDIALYPQQNESRNAMNLSGIWKFKKDTAGVGEKEQWFNGLTHAVSIAVPGSYNEQMEDSRDYLGLVWYEQRAFVPKSWAGQKIFIRVGSASYAAKIWVNGKPVGMHEGGHLPFAFDISNDVSVNAENLIVIQTENELKPTRVPTGNLGSGGMFSNNPKTNYDFFPYAGLERAVWLYSIPQNGIGDITTKTIVNDGSATVSVLIKKYGSVKKAAVKLNGDNTTEQSLLDFSGDEATAVIKVPNPRLWSTDDPYLYQLTVIAGTDVYHLNIGIRSVSVTNKQLLLNGKPVFLKGFGKHEDFPIFGKGLAGPVMVKDYSLLKWVGANSYRTSHYPYDEEYMMMADREGILIIDEIPAVGLIFADGEANVDIRKETCKKQIRELVARDKNHPSVIIWSLANEPFPKNMNFGSGKDAPADAYSLNFFKELYRTAKEADDTRPVTIVGLQGGPSEWLGAMDLMCINRYYGWYTQPGDIKNGVKLFSQELDDLHLKYNKPIIVTEFGADTYAGMHTDQQEMFTEEFQKDFIKAYLECADTKDFVAGMHVWAFADFKTSQGIIRFGGMNYKGVFTRDRKPKLAAYYLRSKWNLTH
ncbi:beta-glucuronidase [Asinibacterium sp. OR53]|uniref:beta-glucuronidase n=1 Tax=Asinibacterium sp. OR53 TaxID=925409 RepID=UPI000688D17E|nr:beta-glucuronidase [Asinibacterium sp. OR53]